MPVKCERDAFENVRRSVRKRGGDRVNGLFGLHQDFRDWDELQNRQWLKDRIERYKTPRGTVNIHVESTDCDRTRSFYVVEIPATVIAYETSRQRRYDDAEGPIYTMMITEQQAEEFEPATYFAS